MSTGRDLNKEVSTDAFDWLQKTRTKLCAATQRSASEPLRVLVRISSEQRLNDLERFKFNSSKRVSIRDADLALILLSLVPSLSLVALEFTTLSEAVRQPV